MVWHLNGGLDCVVVSIAVRLERGDLNTTEHAGLTTAVQYSYSFEVLEYRTCSCSMLADSEPSIFPALEANNLLAST